VINHQTEESRVIQKSGKATKQRLRSVKASRQRSASPSRRESPKLHRQENPRPPIEPVNLPPIRREKKPSAPPSLFGFLLASVRLMVMGVGLAAIAGTTLSVFHSSAKTSKPRPEPAKVAALKVSANQPKPDSPTNPMQQALQNGKALTSVEQRIKDLAAAQPDLTAGMLFVNLDTGAYVDVLGNSRFSAASMIKFPVLVAFFQDVDAGKIKLNEQLVMRPDLIATESGVIQYQKPGSKFSALETADLMITISDNTATNMLIDRLGGAAALNQRFAAWGLSDTAIRNWLPDLKGTNTSSPKDLSSLMMMVSQGDLVSVRSRDRLLGIMQRTVTNTLLPQGLGEGAKIAHKTGDIGAFVGDTGMIDMPNGQRYLATAIVKRPFNDPRAQELIRQSSRIVYQAFDKPLPPVAPVPSPSPASPN
jgi:beta-lactamase class A